MPKKPGEPGGETTFAKSTSNPYEEETFGCSLEEVDRVFRDGSTRFVIKRVGQTIYFAAEYESQQKAQQVFSHIFDLGLDGNLLLNTVSTSKNFSEEAIRKMAEKYPEYGEDLAPEIEAEMLLNEQREDNNPTLQ